MGNIVQESVGALLSPAPAVYCEPAHTNLITYSHEFDNAAWTKSNATITADDTTAPDGSLTADVLGDNSATGTGQVFIDSNAITLSGAGSFTVSVFAKAKQLSWIRLGTENFDARQDVFFDLTNGVVGGTITGSPADYGIEAHANGWYKCWVLCDSTTDLTGNMRIMVANADNNTTVDLDGTSDIYIWGAQVTESSAPLSYVATSGATATANATEPVVTWPSLVNDFLIKVKWTPDNVSGTIALIGSYTDASNSLLLSWASNTLTLTKRVSATDYSATVALTPSADTEYALSVRLSSINGVDVWAASTKGTGDSNTTDAVMASNLSIGDDGNSANHGVGTIRDLKIYKVSPTISDAQVLSL